MAAAPASAPAFRGGAAVHVNGVAYTVLEMLGKGGTSQGFRVLSPEGEVLALKQARLQPAHLETPALPFVPHSHERIWGAVMQLAGAP